MKDYCVICGKALTALDHMLGENRLSDGHLLCNSCLEKASSVHQELLEHLDRFSSNDIRNLLENGAPEQISVHPATIPVPETVQRLPSVTGGSEILPPQFYKRRLKEIKQQLKLAKANLSIFAKGEIKELPHLLATDEPVLAVTDAQFVKTMDAGILLVTPKRMISVSKSMFQLAKIHDYPNETIHKVSFKNHFLSPVIRLHTDTKVVEFECFCDKRDAGIFYDFIDKIYNTNHQQKTDEAKAAAMPAAILEQLEKLAALRENGVLTEEEFVTQKKKLLEKL